MLTINRATQCDHNNKKKKIAVFVYFTSTYFVREATVLIIHINNKNCNIILSNYLRNTIEGCGNRELTEFCFQFACGPIEERDGSAFSPSLISA